MSVIALLNYLNVSVLFYGQHVWAEVVALLGRGLFCVCGSLGARCVSQLGGRGGGLV